MAGGEEGAKGEKSVSGMMIGEVDLGTGGVGRAERVVARGCCCCDEEVASDSDSALARTGR